MQHEIDSRTDREPANETTDRPGAMASTADRPGEPDESGSRTAEAEAQADSPPAGPDQVTPSEGGTVPTFLHEIARQMLAAAQGERARISADVANSLEEHVRQVRIRASKEAQELRRLAEVDVDQINEWSAAEGERLRRETESRITARRDDLERHLRQHDDLIEREISGTSETVEKYQAELDEFVDRLAAEVDPTEIAQLASQLPEPPRVDEVASAARAEAIAEMARIEAADLAASATVGPVGVMDSSVVKHPAEREDASEVEPISQESKAGILDRHKRAVLATRVVLVILAVALIAGVILIATGRLSVAI
jgi:hypothetical protein